MPTPPAGVMVPTARLLPSALIVKCPPRPLASRVRTSAEPFFSTSLSPSIEVHVPLPFQLASAGLLNLSRAASPTSAPLVPFLPPTSNVSPMTLPSLDFLPLLSTPLQPVGQAAVNRPPVLSP